jgi:hypothetical protein
MIHDVLDQMNELLKQSTLSPLQQKELKQLYQQLREELNTLAKTDPEHSKTIADYTTIATLEALRDDRNLDMVERVKEELLESLEQFEVSHPKLSHVLQTLMTHLSSLGI